MPLAVFHVAAFERLVLGTVLNPLARAHLDCIGAVGEVVDLHLMRSSSREAGESISSGHRDAELLQKYIGLGVELPDYHIQAVFVNRGLIPYTFKLAFGTKRCAQRNCYCLGKFLIVL